MTTTPFETPSQIPVQTAESPSAPPEAFAAGASIYRRLDRDGRQPKLVRLAPAVALGVLVLGGAVAFFALNHPASKPVQMAQAAPPAAAAVPAPVVTSTAATTATPAVAAPRLHVVHAAPPAPVRYASAVRRHPREHARAPAAATSATERSVDASATVAASPAGASVAPSAPAPVIQAPAPATVAAPPS